MLFTPRLESWKMGRRGAACSLSAALLLSAPLAAGAQTAPPAAMADPHVNLDLREIPLRDAIGMLFKNTGIQYAVDPNVPSVPITLNIREIALPSALRLITRQAATQVPGLTTAKEGEIYLIRIRSVAPAPAPAEADSPPDVTAGDQEIVWEKIPIQFNNVAVFAMAFGAAMLPTEQDVLMNSNSGGLGGRSSFVGGGLGNGFGSSGFGNSFGGGGLGSTFGGTYGSGSTGGVTGLTGGTGPQQRF